MTTPEETERLAKIDAAEQSLAHVASGMVVGLGSGTTAAEMVRRLGARVRAGLSIRGLPTSAATEALARAEGIPLVTLADVRELDVAIDGADEIDPRGRMIKGRGGAFLREKLIARAARRLVILVDARKLVPRLGATAPVPVEVVPFALPVVEADVAKLGARATLRRDASGAPYLTDSQNLVLDCAFGPLADPEALATRLDGVVGLVEHGLFVGFSPTVILGDAERGARHP
ncbi:MAG: Ribose 5-phosphate isomerase [Myxococcales bacterium]|nr:Ribose 5-phosphate isomerase [Myxococcales bacterium]